jgi:hypothetical protein
VKVIHSLSRYPARPYVLTDGPTLGITFDTIISLLKYTALDPRKTLPLYLAALYTAKGRELALQRPKALKWLKVLLSLGVANRAKNFLDEGVTNNWKNDKYNWNKEIVVVTGGSDGIGAIIVQMLAERGINVVVLDIQKPKFASECDYGVRFELRADHGSSS